jgi:glycosyltransferase involved in cell wall biosynthesis
MPDILLVSDDVVGPRMAGPGIRAFELARVLGRRFEVFLAAPEGGPDGPAPVFFAGAPFRTVFYSAGRPDEMLTLARSCRLLIVQGYILSKFPALHDLDRPIVADVYDPFVLENLFIHQGRIPNLRDREAVHLHDLAVFNGLLSRGDHFLVASDRQRDLVTGGLLGLNRIGPRALDAGADLSHLLSVVPFGISVDDAGEGGEEEGESAFRAAFPEVRDGDIVFLWGGVLSDWYDPVTLLRAFAAARASDPRLKLLFLSTGHPNPLLPAWDAVVEARRLAAELGLAGESVLFHEGWIEYRLRGAFFRRADIGVSIHRTHFETRYAFRTRMLDYIKHGLPILCTEGDVFAEMVDAEGLGRVVPSGDESGLALAIAGLAADAEGRAAIRRRMEAVRERFLWERTATPLVRWCERTLAGEIVPIERPGKDEVVRAVGGGGTSGTQAGFREKLKRWGRPVTERLPARVKARLRRLVKG